MATMVWYRLMDYTLAILPSPLYNPLEVIPLLLTKLLLFGIALTSMDFALVDK
jgi:hypothetical protein